MYINIQVQYRSTIQTFLLKQILFITTVANIPNNFIYYLISTEIQNLSRYLSNSHNKSIEENNTRTIT